MCCSRCPYELADGECGGMALLGKGQPHCMDDDEYFDSLDALEAQRLDAQDDADNRREEYRLSNR